LESQLRVIWLNMLDKRNVSVNSVFLYKTFFHMNGGVVSAKPSQTGARVLKVLEALASHQPIGTRALARLLDDDKSAIHRAITTLADEGWVHRAQRKPSQWEVAPRIMAVADKAYGGYDLKRYARPTLEKLRDESGETVALIVSDATGLVVADVVESLEMLRVVPPIGAVVATERSAAGRAILSLLAPHHRAELLGQEPDEALLDICAVTRERGYAISERETDPGATSLGSALIAYDGHPCGAVCVIGPCERLDRTRFEAIGTLLINTARALSRGMTVFPAVHPHRLNPPVDAPIRQRRLSRTGVRGGSLA
jgi:IclR family acetate operon transcriptional repressor